MYKKKPGKKEELEKEDLYGGNGHSNAISNLAMRKYYIALMLLHPY